jgi:hypothetical protein
MSAQADEGVRKNLKVYKKIDGRVQRIEFYDKGVKLVYDFDPFQMVESASAYIGESLIAKAKKTAMRPREQFVMDIEVEETHFNQKTGEIVYKGTMMFRCRTNIEMGERLTVTPVLGQKPNDVFREWPWAIRY